MKNLGNKVTVITGAGSGIGRALAIEFAKSGSDLAISDIDEHTLNETRKLISEEDIKILTQIVDVSDKEKMHQFAEDVYNFFGRVNIVINNAGVSVTDTIEDVSYENFEWIFVSRGFLEAAC